MHFLERPRRLWTIVAVAVATVAVGLTVAAVVVVRRAEPELRAAIVRGLEARFDSEVQLDGVEVSLWPSPRLAGHGLVLRYQGRTDIPPVIAVRQFAGTAGFRGFFARRIEEVTLDGLEITIPPRRREEMPHLGGGGAPADLEDDSAPPVIGRLVAANTRLTVLSRDPGKKPRVFDIHTLELTDVRLDGPADFTAALTVPTPTGIVEGRGRFGPWQTDEPSLTPLDGAFTFNADLATITGIAGTLESGGSFAGVIERITATGSTRTPDFRLPTLTNTPVPLETAFDAVVDGTNGDVYLTRVGARLGGSAFEVTGAIVRTAEGPGRHLTVDVTATSARIDDVLRLLVDGGRPPLTGMMAGKARLDIAPGEADLVDKLWIDGTFTLREARFQSPALQAKIDELSQRAQGRPGDEAVDDAVSNMTGRFALKDNVLTLPLLTFGVRGAAVQMAGTYGLRSEQIAFRGDVRLDAPVSRLTTGVRSWLLKPFDPLFRKHGAGTRVAIRVDGTRRDPKFGIELGRTLRGR